jgi:hypothetical protein
VVQFTVYETVTVPPDGTVAVREALPLVTEQLLATVSATVWLPAVRLVKVKLPLVAIDCPAPPSTATV